MALNRYIIERDIPDVGTLGRDDLKGAAATSNAALAELAPHVQWVESYVADNKTFCVYLAKDEETIRRHAELSGFPASKITRIVRMIGWASVSTPAKIACLARYSLEVCTVVRMPWSL